VLSNFVAEGKRLQRLVLNVAVTCFINIFLTTNIFRTLIVKHKKKY